MSDDFYGWKHHPITQVVLAEISARINFLVEQLVDQAGINPIEDAFKRGAIKAYQDLVNITASDIGETHGN